MTEQQWLKDDDVAVLVACVRRGWSDWTDPHRRPPASRSETSRRLAAWVTACRTYATDNYRDWGHDLATETGLNTAVWVWSSVHHAQVPFAAPIATRCQLLRDVVGSPFRPAPPAPAAPSVAWPEALAVADACFAGATRFGLDNAHLAVLADALEDAGCGERLVIDHLRSPTSHAADCWAVAWVKGKNVSLWKSTIG